MLMHEQTCDPYIHEVQATNWPVWLTTVNVLNFLTVFTFFPKIKPWTGIHKMSRPIANKEDLDQTASSEAV